MTDDDDDDDDENNTYVYNYGYPEETYQESYVNEYDENYIQQDTSPEQSYVTTEVQRIVNEGSFKIHLVESGNPLSPVDNTGYVLLELTKEQIMNLKYQMALMVNLLYLLGLMIQDL